MSGKEFINQHFRLLWVLTILTVATITCFIVFSILVFEREVVYLAGVISSGTLCLIELIIWINFAKWLIKKEKN